MCSSFFAKYTKYFNLWNALFIYFLLLLQLFISPNYIYVDNITKVKPYIKWVGGKRQLLNNIIDMIPIDYKTYIEPFFGGGALFFHLQPKKAIINDVNYELINSLNVIKNNHLELVKLLDEFSNLHNEKFYYDIRGNKNISSENNLAARFIYLNKTCFNGMYRVNKKNEFNVPYNKNPKPNLYSYENIRSISTLLNHHDIKIFNTDFSKILMKAKSNDFVFVDPPYDTDNNQFTNYTSTGFYREHQEKLANLLDYLDKKKVKWMLTNNPTNFICDRYSKYFQKIIYANRFINSDSSNRLQAAKEIIVTNYEI